MKGIQERISERYPNHSQLEWDVLNGIVAIAKEYANDVASDALDRASERVPDYCVSKVIDVEIITP